MKKENNENTQNEWNKPGSSHPYTQRQLVLERKLKSTCPQVRQFTPYTLSKQDTTLPENKVMHFYASSEIQGKQLTSTYPSNREDSSSLRQGIDLHLA